MAKNRKSLKIITMVTAVVVVLILSIFVLMKPSGTKEMAADGDISYIGQPSIGSEKAPVKLMEYGDYKCPNCKVFHDRIFSRLKQEYIDTGKVEFFFTNYQFIGPDSITAGIGGEAVYNQNKQAFWKYYDVIYNNQQLEFKEWATPEFITSLVKKHIPEVDITRFTQDLRSRKYEQDVYEDRNGATKLQLKYVPALFVNGKFVENCLNYDEVKAAIERELSQ